MRRMYLQNTGTGGRNFFERAISYEGKPLPPITAVYPWGESLRRSKGWVTHGERKKRKTQGGYLTPAGTPLDPKPSIWRPSEKKKQGGVG